MVSYEEVVDFAAKLYDMANRRVPPDVKGALKRAYNKESNAYAKIILKSMLEVAHIAEEENILVCQDTGVPEFFVKVGTDFPLKIDLKKALSEAVAKVTRESSYRGIAAHPIKRVRSSTNTGERVPVISLDVEYGADFLEITALPQGTGSGAWSAMKVFGPYDIVKTIKKFVVDAVVEAGTNPCPPIIVGVGIGGTPDLVMKLATLAIVRDLDKRHPDPDVANMEQELLEAINKTGIGPMGLGGETTCLGVNIETAFTSASWNPVAVKIQCWPGRRATGRIYADGRVEMR
jgi:fumarate hydratase subunit alpha/L(+)-tartrate dehydratase alpha subunit